MTDDYKMFSELRRQLDLITDAVSLATWETKAKEAFESGKITGTQRATLASLWRIKAPTIRRAG